MSLVARWVSGITMYRLMLYVMIALIAVAAVLSAVGILPYSPRRIVLQAAVLAALCWLVNTLIARALKIATNVESSLITGLILAAIAGPLVLPQQWLVLAVMAGAAIASKYLLVWRRSHIFNPAALGVIVSAVALGHPASWWIGSQPMLLAIFLGGILMMAKIRRWHLVASFLGTYLGLLALEAVVWQGQSMAVTAGLVWNVARSPLLLFFVFVMLVEPLTAPQTNKRRVLFGIFVGGVFFALQRFFPAVVFSLELALLAGNVFTRSLTPDWRQAFVLRSKDFFSATIGNFWFEPARRFAFAPGQFLEYTLAHPRADARGVRRYYTIASSPTETGVLLASRFAENGSTFKRALHALKEGDEIVASKVAGDFVLPADTGRKLAFIAGGIGITPFRSMVKYLLDTNQSRDIVMLYGARDEKDLVFRDIFEEARDRFGMRTAYVVAQMIDEQVIKKEVADFPERLFYISGPEPMVQGLSSMLAKVGVPRKQIRRDYFPGYTQ